MTNDQGHIIEAALHLGFQEIDDTGFQCTETQLFALVDPFVEKYKTVVAENSKLREILSFDCTAFPDMENKAIEWANKISGMRGGPSYHLEAISVLEMCEDIAKMSVPPAR